MANIGPTTAFYKVETSLTRVNNEANNSRVRIAAGKQTANASDRVSNSAIADAFRLDFAGTKAGIKGATVVMGYLETGIKALDSASNLLSRLQEVAVLGANNTNTITEHEMLNAEAEGLAQEFNRVMQSATYKGKDVFVDTHGSEFVSMGSRNAELTFGLGKLDYSELYGEARSIGAGLPNAGQLVNLTSLPSDAVLGKSIDFETVIADDSIEFIVSSNLSLPDILTLQDAAGVSIDNNGVVSYTFEHPVYDITTVEIGEVDAIKNGTQGSLKINFYEDATIPGTSTFVNGDFNSTMPEVLSYTEFFKTVNMERTRDGFISALDDENGNAITMGAIADADRTYKNVTLSYQTGQVGTAGTGTVRAHIQTAEVGGVETITNIEIIDGGEGFSANEILVIPTGDQYSQFHGDIAGQELTITGVSDDYVHTVSQPSTTTAYGNQMWGPGETGQYNFDATGAPAENGNNLTYGPGDLKQQQVVSTIIVNDVWEDGETGQYDFDATGAPAENGNNLTYGPGDIKQRQVVGTIIANQLWGDGESGQYDFDATGAPAENGNNLTYGPGDIKQEQVVGTIIDNLTWGDGESGQYDFDATGAPAVNGNNLTYGPGDIKQEQVVNTIQVNDTWGDGESGQYDFDATGAPAVNGNNLTYAPGDIKQRQVVDTIIDNLTWGPGESGQYDFDATGAPAENGNNLTYGPGDIKQEQVVGSVIGNLTWDDGESGQYDFDATGAPAVNGNNLTYGPGDIKQEQVVNTIQVNDTWGDGESGQYDFDATGAPAVNGNNLTYGPGDIKQEQVVSSIIDNLTWGPGESGQYDFDATGAPAVEGNNLTYGPGDIKQEQVVTTRIVGDSPVNEYSLRNVTGPVDVYSLRNITVPQDVYSLRNETGPVNVYSLRNETGPVDVYSLENITVPQDVYSLANVTGPVNVYSLRNVTGPENVYSLANVTVPQNVYSLANVFGTIGTNYLGENILTEVVTDYFQPNTKTVPTSWTSYNDRIDFGSNFTISEFADQNNDVVDPVNGIVDTSPRVEYSIPTPTEAQMALPPYTTIFGRVASDAVKGNDDTAVVSRENDMDVSVTGGALKLDTGKFNFSEGFGILHGPAAVSEVFSADKGDFLKFDYTAQGTNDDYHVAGYIYEVNPDGSAKTDPIMALNETGTSTNGRASVKVPETGNYRFVFIVGTHDLTGGRLAGADMTIDNIVSEKGFLMDETAIAALLKTVNYSNSGSFAGETKTVTSTLRNDESSFVSDEVIDILEGFNTDNILPTLNLVSASDDSSEEQEVNDFEEVNASVLTSKIESIQRLINNARVKAGSQYSALESAILSATDLTTQYEMGYNMTHDLNFTEETAHLAKKQILQQASNAMLAQANNGQRGLLQMLIK